MTEKLNIKMYAPKSMEHDVSCIFEHGEYSVPVDFTEPPRIVDIGANIGAFARWALVRWPGAKVTCFEPFPKALHYLRKNAAGHSIEIVEKAVRSAEHAGRATMYEGGANLGQSSFHKVHTPTVEPSLNTDERHAVEVDVMAASELPDCDLLKIDTEGCELEILTEFLTSTREPRRPKVVMLEYHRSEDRRLIEDLMFANRYILFSGLIRNPWVGTLRFIQEWS